MPEATARTSATSPAIDSIGVSSLGRTVGPPVEAEHTKAGGQATSHQRPCLGGAAAGMDDQDRTPFAFVGDCEVRPVSRGDFVRATDHVKRRIATSLGHQRVAFPKGPRAPCPHCGGRRHFRYLRAWRLRSACSCGRPAH